MKLVPRILSTYPIVTVDNSNPLACEGDVEWGSYGRCKRKRNLGLLEIIIFSLLEIILEIRVMVDAYKAHTRTYKDCVRMLTFLAVKFCTHCTDQHHRRVYCA